MTSREANQRLTNDLKLIIRDAEDLLRATRDEAGDKVKDVRRRLTTTLDSARATCESLQSRTLEVAKATDQVISQHRYESIGIAFGVGLLVGVMLGRQ